MPSFAARSLYSCFFSFPCSNSPFVYICVNLETGPGAAPDQRFTHQKPAVDGAAPMPLPRRGYGVTRTVARGTGLRRFAVATAAAAIGANCASFCASASSDSAIICAARMAALSAPSIATVATGMPFGICTMESRLSMPPITLVAIGTPMTGSVVRLQVHAAEVLRAPPRDDAGPPYRILRQLLCDSRGAVCRADADLNGNVEGLQAIDAFSHHRSEITVPSWRPTFFIWYSSLKQIGHGIYPCPKSFHLSCCRCQKIAVIPKTQNCSAAFPSKIRCRSCTPLP